MGRAFFWIRYFGRRNPSQREQVAQGLLEPGAKLPSSCDRIAEIEWAMRSSPERGRFLAEDLVSASELRIVLLDGLASVAALLGLGGTFAVLREIAAGGGTALGSTETERLVWALSPALGGLTIFVFARAALALFQSWGNALRLDVG